MSTIEERKIYREEYLNSMDFVNDFNNYIAKKEEEKKPKKDEEKKIRRVVKKQAERSKNSRDAINELEKQFVDSKLSDRYNAFKLFSLDASDLVVLEEIESKEERLQTQINQITNVIDNFNKTIENLDKKLEKAIIDKDNVMVKECERIFEKIDITKKEIADKLFNRKSINAITQLEP